MLGSAKVSWASEGSELERGRKARYTLWSTAVPVVRVSTRGSRSHTNVYETHPAHCARDTESYGCWMLSVSYSKILLHLGNGADEGTDSGRPKPPT